MISYSDKSIFETNTDAILNTVNCIGVADTNIALECSLLYPELYEKYKLDCESGKIITGKTYLYQDDDIKIICLPIAKDLELSNSPEYVESGLSYFAQHFRDYNIKSIAFPKSLFKNETLDFETKLKDLDLEIVICTDEEISQTESDMLQAIKHINLNTLGNLSGLKDKTVENLFNNLDSIKRFEDLKNENLISDSEEYRRVYKFIFENNNSINNDKEKWLPKDKIHVILEHAPNFRPLLVHGKETNIFRSGKLNDCDETEIQYLKDNDILTIIDLRNWKENNVNEALLKEPFKFNSCPMHKDQDVEFFGDSKYYLYYDYLFGCYEEMRDILKAVINADSKIVFHCSLGRDRTGVLASILQMLAGSDKEEIIEEYAKTSLIQTFYPVKVSPKYASNPNYEKSKRKFSKVMDIFKDSYGTVENYCKAVGLDESEIEKLKIRINAR